MYKVILILDKFFLIYKGTPAYERWYQHYVTFNIVKIDCLTIDKVILILDKFFLIYKGTSVYERWYQHYFTFSIVKIDCLAIV